MAELADKFGGNAALGRALGFKDGSYVRQMIAGERPITEKKIARAEKLPGCEGWFFNPKRPQMAPPAPPPRFEDSRTLTPEQWEQWQAFKMVATPEERRAIMDRYETLKQLAEQVHDRLKRGEKP